jgi:hypothetical protein
VADGRHPHRRTGGVEPLNEGKKKAASRLGGLAHDLRRPVDPAGAWVSFVVMYPLYAAETQNGSPPRNGEV